MRKSVVQSRHVISISVGPELWEALKSIENKSAFFRALAEEKLLKPAGTVPAGLTREEVVAIVREFLATQTTLSGDPAAGDEQAAARALKTIETLLGGV